MTCYRRAAPFVLALLAVPLLAQPLPHQTLPGDDVRVDWSHAVGFFGHDAVAERRQLIARVQRCVQSARENGWPHEELRDDQIPEHVQHAEIDSYRTSNRSIQFKRSRTVGVNLVTCGLIETGTEEAVLTSAYGRCDIYFKTRTAVGQCDAERHASAPLPPDRTRMDVLTEKYAPGFRAALPRPTGRRKVIAGLDCEIYEMPAIVRGTTCSASAETFPGAPLADFGSFHSIDLERISDNGLNIVASQAGLNAPMSSRLFAVPAGFMIKGMPRAGMSRP